MTNSDRLTGQNVDWYACETKDFIRPSESAQERESQQKLGEKRSKAVQRQPKQNSTWSQTYSFSSRLVDSVYSRVAPLQFLTPMGYPLKFAKLVHLCFIFCRFLQDIIAWNDVTLTFKFLPEKYDEMCPIINIITAVNHCLKIWGFSRFGRATRSHQRSGSRWPYVAMKDTTTSMRSLGARYMSIA